MRHLGILALLVIAPAALGMPANTSLRGRVTSAGQPVAAAAVTATSASLQQPRTTTTGASGTYWLAALPPGSYEVTFSAPHMQTLTRRVIVELARVARADATLEPSEDEETVTSTATTIGVSDTIPITTQRTAETLRRFPVYGDARSVLYLAPGTPVYDLPSIDGLPPLSDSPPAEALEEVTFTSAAAPLDTPARSRTSIHARTHSGGEELSLGFRDTISGNDGELGHLFEAAAGGRIVKERLWFFASGFTGDREDELVKESQGIVAKLTGQPGTNHNLTAAFYNIESGFSVSNGIRLTSGSLIHIGQWSPQLTTETLAARQVYRDNFLLGGLERNSIATRATYLAGDHVLTAGAQLEDGSSNTASHTFLADRWILQRWTLAGTLAYESRLSWQAAATYDLRGDGRRSVIASASRYAGRLSRLAEEQTLGFATAIGSAGVVRIDAIHHQQPRLAYTALQFDWYYRLFDRFGAGANFAWSDLDEHTAKAWLTADIPIGPHVLTATVAHRYHGTGTIESLGATDFALRYSIPIARTILTLAADVENLFDEPLASSIGPRNIRGWVRLGL